MTSPLYGAYSMGDTPEAAPGSDRVGGIEPSASTPAPNPNAGSGPGHDRGARRSLARRLAGSTIKALGFSVAAIGLCVLLALIAAATLHNAQRVREVLLAILHVTRYAPLVYLGLIALLWWRWDRAVDWVIRRGYVPASARELLRSRRDRWVIWLCALALLMAWLGMR